MICMGLSQNPSKRKRCGQWLLTVAKSSAMACKPATGQVDLMTPAEVDFSMGWPSLPFAQEYTQHMPRVMQCLTFAQAASLAGNGMHLAVLGCWWTFIAMHTQCGETAF